ncbi:MAG TPA: response regulator [Burkholderiales bacterium]|nr:response regulator [Burkholderiales bacterium]
MKKNILRRVAIADDSPEFLAAAAEHVATLPGFMLAGTAGAARQALALVEAVVPDVLLLDLGRAPQRSLELVRRVKASTKPPAIVALTLFHTPETLAVARGAGADALVGKESFVAGLGAALASLFPA